MKHHVGWIWCIVFVISVLESFCDEPLCNVDAALRDFKKGFEEEIPALTAKAESYIEARFTEALRSPVILEFRSVTLRQLLLNSWVVEEWEVLSALERWFALNTDRSVRFRLIATLKVDALNPTQLQDAAGSEVLKRADIIDALIRKASRQQLELRFPNQLAGSDVVKESYFAEILTGFRGNETSSEEFLGSRQVCSHDVDSDEGITIKLGAAFTLDTLGIKFAEYGSFSFAVSVSLEGNNDWQYVVLPSEHKSVQDFIIPFRPTRVRYIRLVGASASTKSPTSIKVKSVGAVYSKMVM